MRTSETERQRRPQTWPLPAAVAALPFSLVRSPRHWPIRRIRPEEVRVLLGSWQELTIDSAADYIIGHPILLPDPTSTSLLSGSDMVNTYLEDC